MVVVRVVIQCSFPTATKEDETASGCEKNTEQGRGGGGEGVGAKNAFISKARCDGTGEGSEQNCSW